MLRIHQPAPEGVVRAEEVVWRRQCRCGADIDSDVADVAVRAEVLPLDVDALARELGIESGEHTGGVVVDV